MPETPEEVAALAARVVDEGFTALKLGWGPLGRDVGRDVELASAARDVLGPDAQADDRRRSAMPDNTCMFLIDTWQISGNVDKCNKWNIESIAVADKPGNFI